MHPRSTPTSLSAFAFLPLGLACALAAGSAQAQEVQTVKIAHAGPVSGGIAHIGKDTENGVRLAIDDLNAQNLVIGAGGRCRTGSSTISNASKRPELHWLKPPILPAITSLALGTLEC